MAFNSLSNSTFQSTLPVWGATMIITGNHNANYISIHAPRVGSDFLQLHMTKLIKNFNPRSPCGERRMS